MLKTKRLISSKCKSHAFFELNRYLFLNDNMPLFIDKNMQKNLKIYFIHSQISIYFDLYFNSIDTLNLSIILII
jgi:hypothetical protein